MQLVESWLSDLTFRDNPSFDLESTPVAYTVALTTSVNLDVPKGPTAELGVVVTWHDRDDEVVEGPFALDIAVTGLFRGDAAVGADLEQWLDFNSQFLLWPYCRAYVASVTALSRHPVLTLFTLQLPQPRAFELETGEFRVPPEPDVG